MNMSGALGVAETDTTVLESYHVPLAGLTEPVPVPMVAVVSRYCVLKSAVKLSAVTGVV